MSADYRRIEKAILYLDENFQAQPTLEELAEVVGLSPFHLQRLFTRWAGISPKRFLQFATAEHARSLLRNSRTVLDTAYEAGLSGPGRLHDLILSVDAVTPGQARRRGEGLRIRYGRHATPFGECSIGVTDRGICWLSFAQDEADGAPAELNRRFEGAALERDDRLTAEVVHRVFGDIGPGAPLRLHLRGTNFQLKVWEALLRVPEGSVTTYEDIAREIGSPSAVRAVGGAVGRNPVAYLVPCHRVIRKTGAFGGYHWGTVRKRAMLAREAARSGEPAAAW